MSGSRRRVPPGKAARRGIVAAALLAALLVAAVASGHIERASYWPNPAPDTSVSPPAGGKVPDPRSLATALLQSPPGQTRVVCQPNSLGKAASSIAHARQHGYDIRPHDHRSLGKQEARDLLQINRELYKDCEFHQIQPAVTASGNNDRVVILPGIYTEPTSRAQPTNDPACAQYKITNDKSQAGAVSYAYQFHCPNDQNLIAVLGRALGPGSDPQPPLLDRHNIPNLGRCIRCNFQIEGSGVSADDVVIDGGRVASGNGPPIGAVKDVGIRADRADGFVLRNLIVRHVNEHAIYVLEAEGFLLDRFKTYYAGEYGVLTFVGDHGLIQNCEAAGSGDAGLYPGSSAEGGEQRPPGTPFRYTQEFRLCDSHHNALGYSGTDSNSVRVDHNNFYDNALGFSTDVFTAAGHPGFPQDSDLIEHNNFYSNNFNPYLPGSDVTPTVPVPVGTGLWIAGGNNNVLRNNRFWNNWRRGSMLFAVPDAFICDNPDNQIPGCDPAETNTSYDNSFHDNVMGIAPGGAHQPNGTDFWWSSWPGTTGNCWFKNTSYRPITSVPPPPGLPNCNNGTDPSLSVGTGYGPAISELLSCLTTIDNPDPNDPNCTWFKTPPKPTP
ncbi:MAG: right-handed parallel beta-helix repeat-containing protein [Actinomycetota bacterium]